MDWWQTLLISVVPVLLTLVITSWSEARRRRRDDLRASAEREERAGMAAAARREALEDHWRSERLAAHEEFFALAETVNMLRMSHSALAALDPSDREPVMQALATTLKSESLLQPAQLISDLFQLMAAVRLRSGDETVKAASKLQSEMFKVLQRKDGQVLSAEDADAAGTAYLKARRAYQAAARKELGSI